MEDLNREIKFRAWTGSVGTFNGMAYVGKKIDHFDKDTPLMQFTGLKDKNGKDIYEGDIFKHCIFDGGYSVIEDKNVNQFYYIGLIEQRQTGWGEKQISSNRNMGMWPMTVQECLNNSEVIGNIYENKELIK
jgi:uncharacterized phage protein (TIGR01671 family)